MGLREVLGPLQAKQVHAVSIIPSALFQDWFDTTFVWVYGVLFITLKQEHRLPVYTEDGGGVNSSPRGYFSPTWLAEASQIYFPRRSQALDFYIMIFISQSFFLGPSGLLARNQVPRIPAWPPQATLSKGSLHIMATNGLPLPEEIATWTDVVPGDQALWWPFSDWAAKRSERGTNQLRDTQQIRINPRCRVHTPVLALRQVT